MSQEAKPYHTNVHLTFPPAVSGRPLVCNLTRLFDLDFNISTAQITPRQEGFLTLELPGAREACDKGIEYLCMQCGMCTALCPSSALTVDVETRRLAFDKEKCTVCARCIRICPVGAMQMDAPEEGVLTE